MILTDDEKIYGLGQVKEIKQNIDTLWDDCHNNDIDCDEVSYKVSELEKKGTDLLSSSFMARKLDTQHSRKDNEQFDVTKIKISSEDGKSFQEYDREILSILFPEWTDVKLNKEVGLLNLFYGFVVDNSLTKGNFIIADNFIKTIEDK